MNDVADRPTLGWCQGGQCIGIYSSPMECMGKEYAGPCGCMDAHDRSNRSVGRVEGSSLAIPGTPAPSRNQWLFQVMFQYGLLEILCIA